MAEIKEEAKTLIIKAGELWDEKLDKDGSVLPDILQELVIREVEKVVDNPLEALKFAPAACRIIWIGYCFGAGLLNKGES